MRSDVRHDEFPAEVDRRAGNLSSKILGPRFFGRHLLEQGITHHLQTGQDTSAPVPALRIHQVNRDRGACINDADGHIVDLVSPYQCSPSVNTVLRRIRIGIVHATQLRRRA